MKYLSLLAEWPKDWYCFLLYIAVYLSSTASTKQIDALLSLSILFRVGVISHIPAGRSLKMAFTTLVEGCYVTVIVPGSGKVLTLCEVEVYGYRAPTGEN